jgi:hypothetical protein
VGCANSVFPANKPFSTVRLDLRTPHAPGGRSRPRLLCALKLYAAGESVDAADAFAELSDASFLEAYARLRAAARFIAEGKRGEADLELHRSLEFWRKAGAT